MKCPNCGNEVNPGQEFCGVCFQKIEYINNDSIMPQANNIVESAPVAEPTPVMEPTPVTPNVEEAKPMADIIGLSPEPTVNQAPIVEPAPVVEPTGNTESTPAGGSKKNMKFLIIVVIIILLIAGGCAIYLGGKDKHKPTPKTPSNNQSSQTTTDDNKKEEVKCGLEGDHIHLSDLTEEERDEIGIRASLGMASVYKNSKIKSFVYNGETYDYKEIVESLTNFDTMTKFVSKVAATPEHGIYKDQPLTPEIVAYYATRALDYQSFSNSYFNVLTKEEKDAGKKSGSRHLEVYWTYPKGNYPKTDKYYTLNSADYGKYSEGSDKDAIVFYFANHGYGAGAIKENCGFILEDGRFVHILYFNSNVLQQYTLIRYIYVHNGDYKKY